MLMKLHTFCGQLRDDEVETAPLHIILLRVRVDW